MERSNGRIRGDVVFDKLVALGFDGSDRTVRRAVAGGEVELAGRAGGACIGRGSPSRGCGRSGTGATARRSPAGQTYLFCAWLAWCRFRVVIPVWDKTLPTVIACLDRSMRAVRWCADVLVDGQRTHRVDRSHRRDRGAASVDRRRSATTTGSRSRRACRPTRNPRAGSKRTVQIAKADLVPTDTNLRDDYACWAELVDACDAFMAEGQRPRASDHPPGAGSRCSPRNKPGCIGCPTRRSPRRSARPARCRGRRRSASAVSPTRSRTPSPIERCGSASTATRSSPPTSPAPGAVEVARHRAVDAGEPEHRRRPLPATPGRRARPSTQGRPTRPRPSSWRSVTAPGCG